MKRALQWLLLVAMLVGLTGIAKAEEPTIAVASSLQFALPEVVERFQAETGRQVRLNFGSSGNFRRQIAQGAPFELFLSADELNALALHEEGLTEGEGSVYALGRLVWLQRAGRDDLPEAPLAAVEQALEEYRETGSRSRIALANPEHAPYGMAAREVLEQAGLWEAIQPLKVLGENVSQAAQFALSADTRGGLVAYSLALAPQLAERSEYVLIPEDWHAPLHQRMVLIEGAGETAHAFYAYLQGDDAREILARYGFGLPPTEPLHEEP
ncbi:molybdate ABC transporter substrate-binding protein [Litchfieldella rifensis]|uniref:Molybdate ABC transporter substrate-binding protein n=1 Tax=Litchfieldella rifensis TaxID=762643 RepID=A0ABV7LUG3_9GAMM